MKSSYSLRNITTRTTYADGTSVTPGPAVSTTYPLGYFREDYQYNPTSAATPDFLDDHNGRFCVTPEYPNGIYCYFATVDQNWNSAYPYVVGPTFYGVKNATKVTSITEAVTVYTTTLPVTLLSFTASGNGKINTLKWTTTRETNSSHFEIERSSNAVHFEKIGRVNSIGTTQAQSHYSFIDNNPLQHSNYYRLKQFDKDGKSEFSKVIAVGLKDQVSGIKILPNPASDLIVIQTNDILKNDMHVTLTNAKGQVVMRKDFYQGTTICFLETTTIYDGTYYLTVYDKNVKNTYTVLVKH
jgi:hypothetical protein